MISMLPGKNSNLEEYRPFSNVDLIVTDIDGTLISGSDSVLMQIKKEIKWLRQHKVQLTVATGRTYNGAKQLLEELDIKAGMPVALYNGTVVIEYGTENVIYTKCIDNIEVFRLFSLLKNGRYNAYIYTFEVSGNLFRKEDEDVFLEYVYGLGNRKNEYDVNGLEIKWIDVQEISKLSINTVLIDKYELSEEEIKQIYSFLEKSGRISYTDSGSGFIELKAKNLSKGIIFDLIRNNTNNSTYTTLAIGDNDNDKELFEQADISVAVANASPIAIIEADYICRNENANGFLDMLNVIKNAKKYYGDKEYK